MKKKLGLYGLIAILVVAGAVLALHENATAPSQPATTEKNTTKSNETVEKTPAFNKNQFSTTDPSSIWMVTNKKLALPSSYAPADLTIVGSQQMRNEAAQHLKDLLSSGTKSGFVFKTISGYRSYANQTSTYNGYVARDGQEAADTYSARPGHSEHQTGLAMDIGTGVCDLEICFGDTDAGKWLAAHAYEYGFIVRYQKGKEPLTGYQYEPWHLRYVGKDLASQIQANGQTLEQFFGLEPATTY